MNDFDQLLELKLRHLLDPVVTATPPIRRGRNKRAAQHVLAVEPALADLATEAIPVPVEPIGILLPRT